MKKLKCLKCKRIMNVGKHLRASYKCPFCHKDYLIHGHCSLTIEGQI